MTKTDPLEVLGLEIDKKLLPKIYKLRQDDPGKFAKVIRMFQMHNTGLLNTKQVFEEVENSQPVKVLGKSVEAFDFPAIYCWYKMNPANFTKFFGDIVEKMWDGDKEQSFQMVEEYLEKELG